jgi:cytochrome c-type biogenesis protein CcmH
MLSLPVFAEDLHKLNTAVEKLQPAQTALYKALADELRCPTCTGLSILQSDAPFSVEIRAALVEQIQEGKGEQEILQFFKERFGLWILRTPPKEGFHWFAWYMPVGLIVLGALFIWGVFWRRRRQPQILGIRSTELILKQMGEELARQREEIC